MRLTKQEFLTSSGLQVHTLQLWLEQEWLVPEETPAGPRFSEIDVARAHFIQELKRDLGANDEGIGVILHLVDQLHGMRRALEQLRNDIADLRKPPE
jgi:chaperone modulatory protein CbpM